MERHNTILSEHVEQREFVKYFRQKYLLNHGVKIFAIPNGGKRSKKVAMEMKLEGVDKGVPDLCVPEWFLYIEMKRVKKGYLSKEQKAYKEYLENCGYTVLVCKGCEDAIKKVDFFYKNNAESIKKVKNMLKELIC